MLKVRKSRDGEQSGAGTSRVDVVAHQTRAPGRFAWTWRSSDGSARSVRAFPYFYECVEDARRAGHSVDLGSRDINLERDPTTAEAHRPHGGVAHRASAD